MALRCAAALGLIISVGQFAVPLAQAAVTPPIGHTGPTPAQLGTKTGSTPQFAAPKSGGIHPLSCPAVTNRSDVGNATYEYHPGGATFDGYWDVGADGGVFSFPVNDSRTVFYGSVPGLGLACPPDDIVGIVAMPNAGGYDVIGADGGIFAFGDGYFPPGYTLPSLPNGPIVGAALTPDAAGIWLVDAKGDIYTYGDANYDGGSPTGYTGTFVGIAAATSGSGYWLVTSTGQIYTYNASPTHPVANYFGGLSGIGTGTNQTPSALIGMARTQDNAGYWLANSLGDVYTFNAPGGSSAQYYGNVGSSYVAPQVGFSGRAAASDGYIFSDQNGRHYAFGNEMYGGNTPDLPPPPTASLDGVEGSGNPVTNYTLPCAADPVNCATGDFWETYTDASTQDPGPSLDMARTYNSLDAAELGYFGFGWADSYFMSVSVNTTNETATVIEADGSSVTFTITSPGQFVAPAGILATLTENTGGTYTFVLRNADTYQFNAFGQLTSITDPTGLTTTLTYNGSNYLTTITDSAGNSIGVGYTGGLVSSTTAPGGLITHYYYNSSDELTSVVDPLGNTTTFAYYSSIGLIHTITDPSGGVTTNVYDGSNRVTSQTDPTNHTTTWAYAGNNSTTGTTTITNPDSSVTTENYSNGQMTSETTAAGTSIASTSTLGYDPNTEGTTSDQTQTGELSKTTYDAYGNVILSVDALGNTTSYAYTASNLQWCEIGPADYALGKRCPSFPPGYPPAPGASDPNRGLTINFYNYYNEITATSDPDGNTTAYAYTTTGGTEPSGLQYCSVDPADYQKSVTCPAYGAAHVRGTTSETFDALGNTLTSTDADGNTTTNTYGVSGHPSLPATTSDPDGTKTTFTYNSDGEVTSQVVTYRSYSATTLYAYTPDGKQYCEVDPLETAKSVVCPVTPPTVPPTGTPGYTATIYNAADQVLFTTSPIGGTTQNAYDPAGNLFCTVPPNNYASGTRCPASVPSTPPTIGSDPYLGATITTYDADNRPIQVTNPLGGITLNVYDLNGNVTQTTVESNSSSGDPNVVTTNTYDADNQPMSTTTDSGSSLAAKTISTYDPNGNVYCSVSANAVAAGSSSYQCPPWQTSWIASPPNPVSEYSTTPSATQANNVTLTFNDANGNVVQSTNPDLATTVSVFDPAGRTYCSLDASGLAAYLSAHSGAAYPYSCPSTPPTTAPATGSNPGYSITIFDPNGNALYSSDPDGDTTGTTYDPDDNPLVITDPNGHVTTDCYYWQISTCASASPASGGTASQLYSSVRPATTADPSGEKTTSVYLPGGATSTSTTPAGTITSTYDAAGDLMGTAYSGTASGYSVPTNVSYTYFPDGKRQTMTDGTGTTTYAYDAVDDMTSEALVAKAGSGLSSKSLSYGYFTTGTLSSITYPSYGTTSNPKATYTYDGTGQMASVSDWMGNEVSFAHDADNNETTQVTGITSSIPTGSSSAVWAYDQADQQEYMLTTYLGNGSGISPQVAGAGSSTPTTGGSSLSQSQVNSDFGLKSAPGATDPFTGIGKKQQALSAQTACSPSVYYYGIFTGDGYGTRNADGDITSALATDASNCGTIANATYAYSYDPASRVVYNGTAAQGASPNNLAYDAAGNVTKLYEQTSGHAYTDSSDAADEVLSQSPVVGTGGAASTYTYDTLGDQVGDTSGTTTATTGYNQISQMTSYAAAGATTTYLNNGDGLETSSTASSAVTQLVWNTTSSTLPLIESDSKDYFIYGPGTVPVEQYNITSSPPSSNPTYIDYGAETGISDYLVINANGQLTNGSTYDLFGTLTGTPASTGTVFGYEGDFADQSGSGLDNSRARWYEPGTGTFTSVDPSIAKTEQPYEYADDDSVNEVDASGLDPNCNGQSPFSVVNTYVTKRAPGYSGYRTSTLFCGNSHFGYIHLAPHVSQAHVDWHFFDFFIEQTLRTPSPGGIKSQENGTFQYTAPVELRDQFTGEVGYTAKFFVIRDKTSASIITAYARSVKDIRLTSVTVTSPMPNPTSSTSSGASGLGTIGPCS